MEELVQFLLCLINKMKFTISPACIIAARDSEDVQSNT